MNRREWEARYDAERNARAEAWDKGFSAAWYAALPYEDNRDASESGIRNPYRPADYFELLRQMNPSPELSRAIDAAEAGEESA